ncbi:MAG TPA: ABC transporter permease [Bryobacteraceae bacterium]|nr:ABC transporter permease [Bryobacteraceae bacterium]
MSGLVQDFRYALRQLRKNPGFTAVAVLTLALGIGANIAIFSVIEAVLLRPLPFNEPDRLVWLNGKFPMTDEAAVSPPDFQDYRQDNRTFSCLAVMGYSDGPSNLVGEKPEQVLTQIASANFFDCLGMHPLIGRDFALADEQVNLPQVAILGDGLWKRDFGGDRNILGRRIRIDGADLTVIGVLPSDLPLLTEAQLWLPTPMLNPGMNDRLGHSLKMVGRLKPGITLQQSQADLDAVALRLQKQYPDTNKDWWMRQRPLREILLGPTRPILLLLWGAVGLLLLIACANVANLLLARSLSRQKEFALRAALGASRVRMVREALTGSVTLSLLGGALGVFIAYGAVYLLRSFGPTDVPRLGSTNIDPVVLAFSFGISLLTGVIFGLFPAFQVSGEMSADKLKQAGRASQSVAHKRMSSALVIGEIAISLTLLATAGLLLKSFWRLIHVSPGFQTNHVITAQLSLNAPAYGRYGDPERRARFWRQFEDRVTALPGVESVGATSELPLSGTNYDNPFHIPGHIYGPSDFDDAQFRQVTAGYLSAMRIPLIQGRWIGEQDDATSPGVIVVNQAFANHFFPNTNALGNHLQLMGDQQQAREIVGVVGNIRQVSLGEPDTPEMYVPYAQFAPSLINIVVRAAANPMNLAAALQAQASAADKNITISGVRSMDDVLETSVSQPRFSSRLIGGFAALALLLAAIGLYGVVAYSASQRTNEIGIRMALGATRKDVVQLVLRYGAGLALIGIAVGFIASLATTRLLASMLFEVNPNDPQTFLVVALLLMTVVLGASYVPARRAAKVDPMVALRYE